MGWYGHFFNQVLFETTRQTDVWRDVQQVAGPVLFPLPLRRGYLVSSNRSLGFFTRANGAGERNIDCLLQRSSLKSTGWRRVDARQRVQCTGLVRTFTEGRAAKALLRI